MIWLPILLSIPFVTGLALAAGWPRRDSAAHGTALAATAVALGLLGWLSLGWSSEAAPSFTAPWVPAVGLNVALWLDGTSLFWAWLVLGIGLLVLQYAGHYMDPADSPRRFYASMMLFMGAMLGVVLSRNIVLMFVFWEVTSITSFLLIGHWAHKPEAVAGARRAMLLTAGGGLMLLAGVALLSLALGDVAPGTPMTWDGLTANAAAVIEHPLSDAALILMLLAAFTKSAQFPFHFWLPGAMQAPTPVSAYLHAATMVKAGIYLMGRLYPVFNSVDLWLVVAAIGVITMAVGGFRAILSYDLKELLAWSTVSQLGLLTAYYGFGYKRLGEDHLLTLDLLLVASHALFKAGLFMACGVVDHAAHTRDWRKLGGLWRKMPVTFALFVGGALSMAGMPFTLGFVAKKLFLKASMTLTAVEAWIENSIMVGAVLASSFTMAYCLRMVVLPFMGKPRDAEVASHVHEGSWRFLASPLVLIGLCVIGGLYVPIIERPISLLIDADFFETSTGYELGLFKKADLLFWISMGIYFVAGPLFFYLSESFARLGRRAGSPAVLRDSFDYATTTGLIGFSGWITRLTCSPSLSRSLGIVMVATAGLTVLGWRLAGGVFPAPGGTTPTAIALSLAVLVTLFATLTVLLRGTIERLLALGLVGLLLIGMFVVFHAPDLAITLTLVELAVLIILLLMLRKVHGLPHEDRPRRRPGPIVVALALGLLAGGMTWVAGSNHERATPVDAALGTPAEFFLQNAKYPETAGAHSGGGTNAVNVILVDFRALDTLGEITVLAAVALAALLLLGGRASGHKTPLPEVAPPVRSPLLARFYARAPESGRALILRETAPVVGLTCAALAVVFFFVGHNKPGGGFIGGLLAAVTFTPFYLAFRRRERFPVHVRRPERLISAGLGLALLTGIVPMLLGHAFLHTAHTYVGVPLLGKFELASALAFDLGVFLLVWGVMLAVLDLFSKEGAA